MNNDDSEFYKSLNRLAYENYCQLLDETKEIIERPILIKHLQEFVNANYHLTDRIFELRKQIGGEND